MLCGSFSHFPFHVFTLYVGKVNFWHCPLSIAGGGALPRGPGSDRCADGVLPGLLPARPLQRRTPLRPPQKAERRPDQEADRLRQGVRGLLPPAVRHIQV